MDEEHADRILYSVETVVSGLPARFGIWSWDGFHGCSLSFGSDSVNFLDDKEIVRIIKTEFPKLQFERVKISRSRKRVFASWAMPSLDE